jgi:hypothetical protein
MAKSSLDDAFGLAKRLLRSKEEKAHEQELDRDVQARLGKVRIRRHIEQQKGMARRLWDMGKRALSLNDERQFRQIGQTLLWTQDDIDRWEKYLLAFEVLEAKRDQARTSADFMKSLKAMADSLLATATPQNMAELQRDLEQGLARGHAGGAHGAHDGDDGQRPGGWNRRRR